MDQLIIFLENKNKLDEDMKQTLEEFRSHVSISITFNRSQISKESLDICKVVKEKKPHGVVNIANSLQLITKGRPVTEVMAELREKNRRFKMI